MRRTANQRGSSIALVLFVIVIASMLLMEGDRQTKLHRLQMEREMLEDRLALTLERQALQTRRRLLEGKMVEESWERDGLVETIVTVEGVGRFKVSAQLTAVAAYDPADDYAFLGLREMSRLPAANRLLSANPPPAPGQRVRPLSQRPATETGGPPAMVSRQLTGLWAAILTVAVGLLGGLFWWDRRMGQRGPFA